MRLSNTLMMSESLMPVGKKAFTLAEVLITLSILGVVAALTIPSLVNRQSDMAAQVKLKKAISNYEDVIGVYMAENEQPNAANMLTSCADVTSYFKTVDTPTENVNGFCDFTTADGVAWRIALATGNASVTDNARAGAARYQVALWNANNRVNATGISDNVSNVSALVKTVFNGSSMIDSRRFITSAPLFLEGTSQTAEGHFYCATTPGIVEDVDAGTVQCTGE